MSMLGQLLYATNRLAEAEALMRRALAIDEASYGADHPKVALRLNNLARLLQATNRLAEAEALMRRALAIFLAFTQATGHEHPHLRKVRGYYTDVLQEMGHSEEEVQAELDALAARFGVNLADS
jgi:tetratricopeptide (TPR) repeat protein